MKGSCLCGAVAYEITLPLKLFQYCHCSKCRKVTGSVHASNAFVGGDQFRWLSGEDQVKSFKHPSSKYFTNAFCQQCGSRMPYQVPGHTNMVVPGGSFDDSPEMTPVQNIYWASRAQWCVSVEELPKFDELPPRKKA